MRKPCTNLALKLTLSPNRLKQDSIWHTWSRSSIGCVQIDFREYGMFHANRTPILHQDLHYLQTTEPSFHFCLFTYEYHQELPQRFLSLWCIGHKPYNYLAPKLILSPTRPKRDSIWYTSSSSSIGCIYSSIGCVQIDFWAYGMFHTNRAPILHQD